MRNKDQTIDRKINEIASLRNQIAEMEIAINKERGERLVAEVMLCAILFGAGIVLGYWLSGV